VSGIRIAVTLGPGDQTGVDVELEELLPDEVVGVERELGPLGEELVGEAGPEPIVVAEVRLAPQVDGVLVVGAGKGVQRVARITPEVVALRGGNQEGEQPVVREQGTDRMQPRASVGADRAEERQPDAELIQQLPARVREVRSVRSQLLPGGHAGTFVNSTPRCQPRVVGSASDEEVEEALRAAGIRTGQVVEIGDEELEWE